MSFLRKKCFTVGCAVLRQGLVARTQVMCHPRLIYTTTLLCDKSVKFDESMLKDIVCPLTKRPLKYDPEKNELISEDINAAYPIVNGIPNLNPSDARKLEVDIDPEDENIRHVKDRD